ncbi:MAG: hypothetical protein ABJH68_14325 [Ilumatobacter sp.]|uniref:hypothetical protein n=1 Tax=Ilumatobacter sp. TaxID=1967498 RepID=UPI0032972835
MTSSDEYASTSTPFDVVSDAGVALGAGELRTQSVTSDTSRQTGRSCGQAAEEEVPSLLAAQHSAGSASTGVVMTYEAPAIEQREAIDGSLEDKLPELGGS